SISVALLAHYGYEVVAVTGRSASPEYLLGLGAKELITREEMAAPARPLERQRWAGAIDTVGDQILGRVIAETNYNGTVAACGLAASHKLPTTVMPFILRNVRLQGVDSVSCPAERRQVAWNRLAEAMPEEKLAGLSKVISLADVPEAAAEIVAGQVRGRVVVDLSTN
ncbi:MAG: zinc-binding dehydrogenase, partial [Pontibacterium sp.]